MKDRALWICGRRWGIRYFDEQLWSSGRECYGYTDKDGQVIAVSKKTADPFATLIHEVGHAILNSVANAHPDEEEQCVQAFETGWVSILRDGRNGWFLAALSAKGQL